MNRNWINTFISFFVLLLLQIFVLNQISLGVYGSVFAYVMFILMLPAEFSALSVLLLAATMGLAVDLFSSDTLGLHMAACSAIGFLRPLVLKRFTSPNETLVEVPSIGRSPHREYLTYSFVLVVTHHLVYFILEAFSLSHLPFALARAIVSALLTTLVIYSLALVMKNKDRS